MFSKNFKRVIYILIVLIIPLQLFSQNRTVGLFLNDTANTYKGYTLMAPNKYTSTYLINNEGRLVHKWSNSAYSPGNSAYLLPNGNLLRSCKVTGYLSGGEGGRVEEFTWNDSMIWYFDYNTQNYISHHDVKYLPNGNILILAIEKKTISQALASGFDSSKFLPEIATLGYLLPDYIIEVQPTYPSGGTIVWEWHVWDHLIQDFDSTKLNYGVVPNHPELIDCDGTGDKLKSFLNHLNSINYNAKYDQIILSCRANSEIWVIDHSTTTSQSSGHTGGRYNHGGDLLYRWGNPVCYKLGTAANRMLYQQHCALWVDSALSGAGNLMVFNNGIGRNYTSVDQFAPPVDSLGFYYRANGTAFGPTSLSWTYTATPNTSFYCATIGGGQRLPNGNTLISNGLVGSFFEVTSTGQIVWRYVNPVTNTGPLHYNDSIPVDPQNTTAYNNYVFKVQRYSPTYPGLIGKDLTPGNFIELYYSGVEGEFNHIPGTFALYQNYPNPFNPVTNFKYDLPKNSFVKLTIYDIAGKEIETLVKEKQNPGTYKVNWNASQYPSGVYFYKLVSETQSETKKMILIK
jgi:Arylsulfotransferase (ASST)/Secretion system C-terminal sorting domain